MTSPETQDSVVVVTGGSGGIGAAVSKRLITDGAFVIVSDVDVERARVVAAELGEGALPIQLDVASKSSVEDGLGTVLEKRGRIDGLVHCAGVRARNVSATQLSLEEWRSVQEINLTGTFLTNTIFGEAMVERGYGRIVNIASIAGLEGNPNAAAYSASKAGVIAFTKSFGKETATTGLLVNAVAPGATETPMLESVSESHRAYIESKVPMGRPGTPQELAALVAWLVSPECSFSTGAVFDFTGGRSVH